MPGSIEVFISHAPRDAELRAELEQHLAVLRRQGLIRAWHIEQIAPGQGWRTAIESHVSSAQLILLLVSASFFASDDCHDIEMARALQRWQRGEAQVVPILLSPCLWEATQLHRLQPLPDNRVPVTSWSSRAEAWANVARGIHRVVERMTHGSTAAMPGAAIVPSRPAPTIAQGPIHEPQRASAPSHPAMGPASPRASEPSQPTPISGAARPSAPSAPAWTPRPAAHSGADALRVSTPEVHPAHSAARPPLQPAPAWPRRSSFVPVIAAAFVALAGVGVGSALIYREFAPSQRSEGDVPPPLTDPGVPSPAPNPTLTSWPGGRQAPAPASCAPPCCGGSECAVTAENTTKPVCMAGEMKCNPCVSGRTCIPGSCEADLDPNRKVHLRLAHAVIRARLLGAGEQVCVRRSASTDPWSCAPCDQSADSPVPPVGGAPHLGPPLDVADLNWGRGIDIWVGSTALGASPTAFHGRAYHATINVTALCRGLKFKLYEPIDPTQVIGEVIFYLDDP